MYSQVIKLLEKEKILQLSRTTPGRESYVKQFDGYQHLVVMLFGVLKHFDSLRELEIGMKAEATSSDIPEWTTWSGEVRLPKQTYAVPWSTLPLYMRTFQVPIKVPWFFRVLFGTCQYVQILGCRCAYTLPFMCTYFVMA